MQIKIKIQYLKVLELIRLLRYHHLALWDNRTSCQVLPRLRRSPPRKTEFLSTRERLRAKPCLVCQEAKGQGFHKTNPRDSGHRQEEGQWQCEEEEAGMVDQMTSTAANYPYLTDLGQHHLWV